MTDMRVKLVLDMLDRVSNPARRAASSFSDSMARIGQSAKQAGERMSSMGGMASLKLTAPLGLMTKQSIETQKSYDAVRSKMIGVFRDTALAEEQMRRLRAESDRMGTSFLGTTDSYAGFSASVLGAGFSVQRANDMFKNFTETAVALHATPERMGYIFTALQQMAGKPKVAMEELKTQLSDHIPNAIGIAAKAMNMSTAKFVAAVEKGKIKSADFLPRFARQMREDLGGGFEAAAQGIQSVENRQRNLLNDAQLQANRAGLANFYERLWQVIGGLSRAFMSLSAPVQKFVIIAGIGAMVMGPLLLGIGQFTIAAGFMATGIGRLLPLMLAMTTRTLAFGAALLTTPVGWIALAVAAIAGGAYLIIRNWEKVSTFFTSMWAGIKQTFADAVSWISTIMQPLLAGLEAIGANHLGQRPMLAGAIPTRATGPAVASGITGVNGLGGKIDTGGTLNIKIDSTGQPSVKDVQSNDSRMNFNVDTGLLMGAR